jgi:cytochrome c553
MLANADAVSIGRGATLALRCTMCHGARGLSDANSPNLAGQYPIAIYQQLVDLKTGVRISAVMTPQEITPQPVTMPNIRSAAAPL